MSLKVLSAGMAATQRTLPTHAIQTADFSVYSYSNTRRKFIHLKYSFHLKQPFDAVRLLGRHRGELSPSSSAFSLPNDSNGGERCLSNASTDYQMFIPPEDSESCSNSDTEACASLSQSGENLSSNAGYLGDHKPLIDKMKAVHLHVLASEQWNASILKLCHRNYVASATNLIHHLALKYLDIEQLKEDASSIGLWNLETINSCILPSIATSIQLMENNAGNVTQKTLHQQKLAMITMHNTMRKKVVSHRNILLGSLQEEKSTHIMVTVGDEAINSDELITNILKAGASVIRINCAHGNPSVWNEIINKVKRSSQMLEKACRILMDLAGPKLRTSKLKPGRSVIKISPKKNATGNVISPAQVWLSHKGAGGPPSHLSPDAVLFIDNQEFLSELKVGDTLRFHDARGKDRRLKVSRRFHILGGTGYMTECTRTAYIDSETELCVKRKKGKSLTGQVVDIPVKEPYIRLRVGDLLVISQDSSFEEYEPSSTTTGAHLITCSSGLLFDSVKPGEPIAFDDGKIWGVIQGKSTSEIVVSITHAGPKGTKLGSQKSINIPNSNIRFEGFTSKDLMDLEFVAAHADMVGLSFVRDVNDIVVLRQELEQRKLDNLGIVLKIETKSAFENLPMLLLEAMKSPNPLGVMIARGDLAVECGWERLAHIQEEILSICSAAHVPVIWATQVLESLVKSGVPTRAEITDVSIGRRASCIMLNKGKNIVEATTFLDTVLQNSSKKMKAKLKPLMLNNQIL
ncbi:hypothetical protein L6164_030349 [Bauhinia variegata]|uniref:Uncharacterized protein n=1 Tax=Bauhinia variegata TaxID=167791 RepID=A0ACB9LC30_BAUVA|nr:hypothetical protein L6164_030349 [Bauhinia variegata]